MTNEIWEQGIKQHPFYDTKKIVNSVGCGKWWYMSSSCVQGTRHRESQKAPKIKYCLLPQSCWGGIEMMLHLGGFLHFYK